MTSFSIITIHNTTTKRPSTDPPKTVFRGCHRYVTLIRYIYIYIICVPTRNRNNEFILEFILRENKIADFKRRQLEIGVEFVR